VKQLHDHAGKERGRRKCFFPIAFKQIKSSFLAKR
jgi:hypothetical protein